MERWSTAEERQQFIRSRGVAYLSRAELADHPSFGKDLKQSPYYRENRKEFEELSRLYGPPVRQEKIAPVFIAHIAEEVGFGLFAGERLEAGEFIGEYTGIVQEGREVFEESSEGGYETDYTWDYPDAWYEERLFEINALRKGNELRYVNHSFSPNVRVEHTLLENRWVIFFLASERVEAGTQLTVDYGEEYWFGGFRELVLL